MTPADLQIPERGSAPVVEDPAITAAKEEEAAKAAWLALPADTLTDEKTPKYKAAVKRLTKAENAFADAPITSIAGATIKLRALGKDLPEDGAAAYATGHVKTVLAFLEGFTGASSVVDHDHLDAALVALSRELVEAKAEEDRAVGKTDDALKAYHAAADRPEKPAQVEIKYRTGGGYTTSELKSVEAIQGFREHVLGDCIDPIEVVTARLDAALGEWRKYEAEDKKVSDRVGLTERWTEQEAASDRREKIEHRIIATRPETAVGLVVLVKLLAWYQEIGPEFTDHRERDLGRNILAALERLTPGLAEIGWGPAATPDPAVVALAEYRVAKAADDAISGEDAEAETPEYQATGDRREAARDAVYTVVPTSMAGMAAKVRFIVDHEERGNDLWVPFDQMAKSMLPFLEGGAVAAPDPVVTLFAKWAIIRDEATAHGDAIDALDDDAPEGARDEINTRLEAAWAQTDALEDRIMATTATTIRGVAIKIRLATHYAFDVVYLPPLHATPSRDIDYDGEHGAGGALNNCLVSALRDAERLAGVS